MPAVEFKFQQSVPSVTASACRTGDAEDEAITGLPGKGTRLHRGNTDGLQALLLERDGKAVHFAAQQRLHRLRRIVAR